jgi:hypothetical protein
LAQMASLTLYRMRLPSPIAHVSLSPLTQSMSSVTFSLDFLSRTAHAGLCLLICTLLTLVCSGCSPLFKAETTSHIYDLRPYSSFFSLGIVLGVQGALVTHDLACTSHGSDEPRLRPNVQFSSLVSLAFYSVTGIPQVAREHFVPAWCFAVLQIYKMGGSSMYYRPPVCVRPCTR